MPLLMLLPVLGAALILRRQLKLSDSLAILCAVSGILIGVYLGALTGFLQGRVIYFKALSLHIVDCGLFFCYTYAIYQTECCF